MSHCTAWGTKVLIDYLVVGVRNYEAMKNVPYEKPMLLAKPVQICRLSKAYM
jgi:hypothetical protein